MQAAVDLLAKAASIEKTFLILTHSTFNGYVFNVGV